MIIDRHNYEECFILYWDNELTAAQKLAVENFVKENSDLQEEFKILGETRFTPDAGAQLEEKDFLLSNSFINITNYEEQLLDYIDDELDDDQSKAIEKAAVKYPSVQKELRLLQKTKLQPETEVVFPDRSILYRREEKPDSYRVRIISMTWFRVAVAAVIILIAGFATFRLLNNNNGINNAEVVRSDESREKPAINNPDQSISNPGNQIPQDTKNDLVNTDQKSTKKPPTDKKDVKGAADETVVLKTSIAKRENKNNLPEEKKRTDLTNQPEEATHVIAYMTKDKNQVETFESDKANNILDNSSVTKASAISSVKIDDSFEREKGGLKEILRKTTRVFERRTKIQTTTEDNKLLVGVFAVSLK